MTAPTPDPLALAGQIQRERDSFIPGTALLRAWSQRHPAVVRLAEVVHAVERCGASTALTDVVVLCEVLRQTIHDALDQRDALAAALRAAHEENARLLEEKTRLWGALGDLIDAVEDKGLSCCGCGCCCNGSKHKAMRAARDAADAALAGGKGEG